MTEYIDIPQINDLYREQQLIQTAIYNLESGGAIINMTVAPSTDPTIPNPTGSAEVPVPMSAVSVIINLNLPNPPDLVVSALTALNNRDNEITQELASLGVVNTPVR